MTVEAILDQAKLLSPAERKELVKRLVDTIDAPTSSKPRRITEFRGIAAHLADDDDPQAYVNRMRDEWDEG